VSLLLPLLEWRRNQEESLTGATVLACPPQGRAWGRVSLQAATPLCMVLQRLSQA